MGSPKNYSHSAAPCAFLECNRGYAGIKKTVLKLDVNGVYILTFWVTTNSGLPNGIQILIDGTLKSNMTGFKTGEDNNMGCVYVCVRPSHVLPPAGRVLPLATYTYLYCLPQMVY